MQRLLIVVGAALLVVGAWWCWRGRPDAAPPSRPRVDLAASDAGTVAATHGPTGTASRSRNVRKLSRDARRRLADEIAAARVARLRAGATAGATAPAPTLADDTIRLEQVAGTVRTALEEAIPLLADCYPADATRATAAVDMVLFSEPDIGTVIDTPALRDERGQPLARELDDCLRTTIESLGLPPLEAGGRLPLTYSFKFE